MFKVTSRDFQRHCGYYQNLARKEAVTITHDDKDHLVILNADEYYALCGRTRIALSAGEMPESDIRLLEQTHMSSTHAPLNNEIDEQDA